MSNELNFAAPVLGVGRYYDAEKRRQDLAFSYDELERSRLFWARIFSTFHFRAGDRILLTALFDESVQYLGAERAIMSYNMVAVNADSSLYDAKRVESIIRRFKLAGIVGLSADTLEGLRGLGFDPEELFKDMVVWARPGAYEQLVGKPGMRVYRVFELGPATLAECSRGQGVHIDRHQWNLDVIDEEVVISSRLERCVPFKHYRTGVAGKLITSTCVCGASDPRIALD